MPVRFRLENQVLASALRRIDPIVRKAGGRTWLVGGCVRDLALDRQPHDLDLEICGVAPGLLHQALSEHFSVQFVGRAFGVFKLQGLPIDISLPSRRVTDPDSVIGLTAQADPAMGIEEALSRRDFTINAMAWDPDTLELCDPFRGRADLETRTLRHVSDRFGEDPLRVLRGMQLAARFGLTVAPETVALCRTLTQDTVPSQRLWGEWQKLLLQGVTPSVGLRFLRDCGWLRFYPELAALDGCEQDPEWHPEGDVWVHTLHCMDWFATERTLDRDENLIVGLGVLCHDLGKPATTTNDFGRITSRGHEPAGEGPTRQFLERLTNQRDLADAVVSLVLCHLRPRALFEARAPDSAVRRLSGQVGRIDRLVRVARADHAGRPPIPFDGFPPGAWLLERARALEVVTQAPIPLIMGRHVLALGVPPGPAIGQLVDECFEAQLDGIFSTLDEGLVFLKQRLSASGRL